MDKTYYRHSFQFYYSENYNISDNSGSYKSTDNPRYSTDCGSPNEDKGAYRNILGEVGGRTERKMHHDSLSTSLSFAGKCVQQLVRGVYMCICVCMGVYLAFSIVSYFLFPSINVNLNLNETMYPVREMNMLSSVQFSHSVVSDSL